MNGYRRDPPGTHPEYLSPDYRSTRRRAPDRPLIPLAHTLSEITGPVYGHERVRPLDHDLTRQHDGEPLGKRIVVLKERDLRLRDNREGHGSIAW